MVGKLIQWILLILLVLALLWCGTCVYSNVVDKSGDGVDFPAAKYELEIVNTGNVILTDELIQEGNTVGSRVFTLHGVWEVKKTKFRFKDIVLVLDEKIFGKILVKRR